ncbi:MAG: hypothetical protein KKB37_09585 [Alphaproteobacteria bacterium]|nr:hypothetical protein [Alphaproteobacteria bacterium]
MFQSLSRIAGSERVKASDAVLLRRSSLADVGLGRALGSLQKLYPALALSGFGALLIAVFARIMNYEVRRDEQLYVPPASLLDHQNLYVDFFYNHVPYSAYLFRGATWLLGTDHLLFASRLTVFAGWLVFCAAIAWLTMRLTRSRTLAAFLVLAVLTNDMFLSVTGMTATNNFIPLPFAFIGLGLVAVSMIEDKPAIGVIIAAGIFLSVSAGLKASAISFIFPLVAALLLLPASQGFGWRLKYYLLPLAVGGLVGAAPVLFLLAQSPELFLAHIVGFHTGPHVAYWQANQGIASDVAMSIADRIKLAYLVWFSGANLIVLMIALLFAVMATQRSAGAGSQRRQELEAIATITVAGIFTLAFAFLPKPGFPQYYTPPMVCVLLLLILGYRLLQPDQRSTLKPVLVAASVVLVLANLPRLVQHLPKIAEPDAWTVTTAHNAGLTIRQSMAQHGASGPVATLAPIYALEAGLEVYPEFATGQFAYRTAEFTNENLSKYFRSTSPAKVAELFASRPPAAILVGFEEQLEAPMLRYALAHGYVRIDDFKLRDRYGAAVLYVRTDPRR